MPPSDAFDHPIRLASEDGTELAAYDLGGARPGPPDSRTGADGPDVLLVHATGLCAGVWAPMAAHLDGVRVAALDVRGHGRSGPPPATMQWSGTAQDVLAAVDGLGLRRPVGVGHSMGGASLLLAEQARPGTFAALWLFEPIVFPPGTPGGGDDNPMVQGALRRRDTFPSAEAALVNFGAKPPLSELHPEALEAYVRWGFAERPDGTVTLRCRPQVEADTFRHGARHDAWEHLGEVGCPVVVLRGRPEDWGPAALAPGIADRIPGSVLEEHPELGHFGPLEQPEAMAGSVMSLVSRVAPQRSA